MFLRFQMMCHGEKQVPVLKPIMINMDHIECITEAGTKEFKTSFDSSVETGPFCTLWSADRETSYIVNATLNSIHTQARS
jgi:hypothetical protein